MSTEINIEKLYENCIKILTDLIGFKTISGDDNSNLINYCEEYLHKLGATSFKTFDQEKKRVNLFATFKAKKTNGIKPIILSGHTDTVPVSKSWSTDPFKATIKDDKLYGRGACAVSYTHLRAHETSSNLVCRLEFFFFLTPQLIWVLQDKQSLHQM